MLAFAGNSMPWTIAVHPARPLSPVARQHSLPSGRYSLLAPAGSHQLCLAHSLDDLVGAGKQRWRHSGLRGRTVTLKVKFSDFQITTRSRSSVVPISNYSTLASISAELLTAQFPLRKRVRLIGVSISSLSPNREQVNPQMNLSL
jgi:hypothetical protein